MWLSYLKLGIGIIFIFFYFGWAIFKLFFSRRIKLTIIERSPLYFSLGVGLVATLATILFIFKIKFSIFAYILIGVGIIFLVAIILKLKKEFIPKWDKHKIYAIIIFLFALTGLFLTYYGGFWLSHTADSFNHIKAAKEIINQNQIFISDIFRLEEVQNFSHPDPIFGIWHTVLALLSFYSTIDIVRVIQIISGLCTFLLILSFATLVDKIIRNKFLVVTVIILYFIIFWRLKFPAIFYPNQVTYIILWTAILLFLKFIYDTNNKNLVFLLLILAIALPMMHLAFTELWMIILLFFPVCLLIFGQKKYKNTLKKILILLFLTSAIVLPIVFFETEATIFSPYQATKLFEGWRLSQVNWGDLIKLIKNSFSLNASFTIISLILFVFWRRDQIKSVFLITLGLLAPIFMLVLILGFSSPLNLPPFFSYHLRRVMILIPFAPFLIGGFLADKSLEYSKPFNSFKSIMGVIILLILLFLTGADLYRSMPNIFASYNPNNQKFGSIAFIKQNNVLVVYKNLFDFLNSLPKGSRILSDPRTSYEILSLTDHYPVNVPRTHILHPDGQKRERVSWDFLYQNIEADESAYILEKYKVDYVLAQDLFAEQLDKNPLLKKIETIDGFSIYFCDKDKIKEFDTNKINIMNRISYEIENFDGVLLPEGEMAAKGLETEIADKGWVFYKRGAYSSDAAVLTTSITETISQTIATLEPGKYLISFRLWDYGNSYRNKVEVTFNDQKEIFEWQAEEKKLRYVKKDIILNEKTNKISIKAIDVSPYCVLDLISIELLAE